MSVREYSDGLFKYYKTVNKMTDQKMGIEVSVIEDSLYCCLCTNKSYSIYAVQDLSLKFYANILVDYDSEIYIKNHLFVDHLIYLLLSNNRIGVYSRGDKVKEIKVEETEIISKMVQLQDNVAILTNHNTLYLIKADKIEEIINLPISDDKNSSWEINDIVTLYNNSTKIILLCKTDITTEKKDEFFIMKMFCLKKKKIIYTYSNYKISNAFSINVSDTVIVEYKKKELKVINLRKDKVILDLYKFIEKKAYKRISVKNNLGLFVDDEDRLKVVDLEYKKVIYEKSWESSTDGLLLSEDSFISISPNTIRLYSLQENQKYEILKQRRTLSSASNILPYTQSSIILVSSDKREILFSNIFKDEQNKILKVEESSKITGVDIYTDKGIVYTESGNIYLFSQDKFTLKFVISAKLDFCKLHREILYLVRGKNIHLIHSNSKRHLYKFNIDEDVLAIHISDINLIVLTESSIKVISLNSKKINKEIYFSDKLKSPVISCPIYASSNKIELFNNEEIIIIQLKGNVYICDFKKDESIRFVDDCYDFTLYGSYLGLIKENKFSIIDIFTGVFLDSITIAENNSKSFKVVGAAFVKEMKFLLLLIETGECLLYYNRSVFDFSNKGDLIKDHLTISPSLGIDEVVVDEGISQSKNDDSNLLRLNHFIKNNNQETIQYIKALDKNESNILLSKILELCKKSCGEYVEERYSYLTNSLLLYKSKYLNKEIISELFTLYSGRVDDYNDNLMKSLTFMDL